MLHKKPFIVPIPYTDKLEPTVENFGAAEVHFTDDEFKRFEEAISKIKIYGNRTDKLNIYNIIIYLSNILQI